MKKILRLFFDGLLFGFLLLALIGNALSLREVPMAYAAESSDSLTSSFTYTVLDKDTCSLSGSNIKGQKYDFFLNSVYPSDNMISSNSSAILKISDLLGIHIVNITLNIASGKSSFAAVAALKSSVS